VSILLDTFFKLFIRLPNGLLQATKFQFPFSFSLFHQSLDLITFKEFLGFIFLEVVSQSTQS